MDNTVNKFIFSLIVFILSLGWTCKVFAGNEKIPAGSIIIDMGVTPQTIGNGLKPYGLVYNLVNNYTLPIKWVINPVKTKDGIDIIHNGKSYRGGPFILPVEFRNPTVDAFIQTWVAQGVVVDSTVHDMIVPVNTTITYFPIWTLDLQNGKLALPYFANAGIPATAYRFEIPANLDGCDDLFIMPHADPEWSTHNNLLWWNSPEDSGGAAGWIWANCHAVSVLENITNPADPTEQMNFLSAKGAVSFKSHGKGTPPYTYNLHADPIMQFMGIADGALLNGSEQIYMPENSTWLPTTKIGIDDPDNPDIPSLTPGEASPMLFGPGFGNYDNGRVMYAAGHSQDKGPEAEKVSAQRAFFNFAFQAIGARVTHPIANIPDTMAKGVPLVLEVSTADKPMSNFTIEWVSQCAGTFSSTTDSIVTFTPTTESNACFFMVIIRDSCNRPTFAYKTITVTPSPLPPLAVNDTASTLPYLPVVVNVLANDFDPNGDPLIVSGFIGANPTSNGGLFFNNGNGTVTYTPDPSFTGWDTILYILCDTSSLCDTAKIAINVAFPDNDNDGIADNIDIDDDNDGIKDVVEGKGVDPTGDLDSDAIPNYADADYPGFTDSNFDNINDNFDTDLDGVPDLFDLDSDNDGIPDAMEANNGLAHASYSAITATITGVVGVNGWPDAVDDIETANTAMPVSDFDGDTQKDFQDLDSDDDGIVDLREAGGTDADNNAIIDAFTDANVDGINDATLSSPLPITNSDADVLPNYIDIDSENDGIIDNIEGQTTAGYTAPSGLDSDGDGLDNAYDPDNFNAPIIPVNFDGDANPDYLDTDTDNDSVIDRIEGNDLDSNNVADKTYTGADADGDGLDNAYDPDFIVCTATALGQPANGGCAILQNFDGADDRDWRDIDDDNDYIVTSGETGDANTNGQPDYLEYADGGGACTPPEIYYPDLTIDSLAAVTACYTNGVGNAANGTGGVDGVYTDYFGHLNTVVYNFGGPIPKGSKIYIYGDGTGTVTVGRNSGIPSCGPSFVHLHNNLNINPVGVVTITWHDPNIVVRGNFGSNVRIDAFAAVVDSSECVDPGYVAVDDYSSTYANLDIAISVLPNDTNNLDSVYFSNINTYGSGATVIINGNNTLQYYPPPNFTGVDSFEYQACNELGFCDIAWVYVIVGASGCPLGLTPTFALDSSYVQSFLVCRLNSSYNNDKCDPEILGIPDENDISSNFSNIADSLLLVMDSPIETYGGDATINVFVADGQWDPDPGLGFTLFVSNDNVSWTEIGDYLRPASVTSVTYGGNTFNTWLVSETISIPFEYVLLVHLGPDGTDVNFDAVEVVHYIVDGCVNAAGPFAVDDSSGTTPNALINIDVLANDYDIWGDTLVIDTIITAPTQGGTAVINPGGTVDFTPAFNFTGIDTFEYIVCDTHSVNQLCDTAQVIVSVINNSPVAVVDYDTTEENISVIIDVLANDTDSDGDPLSITQIVDQSNVGEQVLINADNTILYIPSFGFLGIDSFAYEVCDPHSPALCDTAWVYVTVIPFVNSPPIAVDDTVVTEQNIPVTFNVLDNDIEPELQNQVFVFVAAGPSNGTIVSYGDGNITYTPNLGYIGSDLFSYIMCDTYTPPRCDAAVVRITVTPPQNNPPQAYNDFSNAFDGFTSIVNVLDNDTDTDGNLVPASVTVIQGPLHGSFINNLDSTISYQPDPGYTGLDSLVYVVCDDGTPLPSECDTATLFFTVYAVNQPPLAVDDYDTTSVNVTLQTLVTDNDSDPENGILTTYPGALLPTNGTVSVNANGIISYTPDTLFTGDDFYNYVICDDGLPQRCDSAIVYVHVQNDPPVTNTDYDSAGTNVPTLIDVLANDLDPNWHFIELTGAGTDSVNGLTAQGGTVTLQGDSILVYTSAIAFAGVDTFYYTVCDTQSPALCAYNYAVITVSNMFELCNNGIDDDGDGLIDCDDTLDCVPDTAGAITVANDTICGGAAAELYTIAPVVGAVSYDWTVPLGAVITAGQGTTSISVDWGSASGDVCVRVFDGTCYSPFKCSAILVNNPPGAPAVIFH